MTVVLVLVAVVAKVAVGMKRAATVVVCRLLRLAQVNSLDRHTMSSCDGCAKIRSSLRGALSHNNEERTSNSRYKCTLTYAFTVDEGDGE